jgi:hypothetical protein
MNAGQQGVKISKLMVWTQNIVCDPIMVEMILDEASRTQRVSFTSKYGKLRDTTQEEIVHRVNNNHTAKVKIRESHKLRPSIRVPFCMFFLKLLALK